MRLVFFLLDVSQRWMLGALASSFMLRSFRLCPVQQPPCPQQRGSLSPLELVCCRVGCWINHRAHCALFITHCSIDLCLLSATPTTWCAFCRRENALPFRSAWHKDTVTSFSKAPSFSAGVGGWWKLPPSLAWYPEGYFPKHRNLRGS